MQYALRIKSPLMANSHLRRWRNSTQLNCWVAFVGVNSNYRHNSTQFNCSARLANNAWFVHNTAAWFHN